MSTNNMNSNLINAMLGESNEPIKSVTEVNAGDNSIPGIGTIDMCLCRYNYTGEFDRLDPAEFSAVVDRYQKLITDRFDLISNENVEDRNSIAEAILHNVTLAMKNLGYEIDYNDIRSDISKEMMAMIAITDMIAIYHNIIIVNTYTKNTDIPDIFGDEIENANLEFIANMEEGTPFTPDVTIPEVDDHNVSGLLDENNS